MVRVKINGRTFTLSMEEFFKAIAKGKEVDVVEIR